MKLKTSTLLWTFLWCWFMGITAISIGFGALFPSMNLVAKPFVCPGGKMDLSTQVYNPYPGNTITTLTWYCIDEASGTKRELGIFPMSLYSGTIYGWLFFGVVVIGMLINVNRRQKMRSGIHRAERIPVNAMFENTFDKPYDSENVLIRMKELKDLRTANLISETEYEEKRTEILKSL